MGAPNKSTGKACRQRMHLPRIRKAFLMRFKPAVWKRLLELAEEGESATETLERLVVDAKPQKHVCA